LRISEQDKQRPVDHDFHHFTLLRIELLKEVDHVRSNIAYLGKRKIRKSPGWGNPSLTTEARRKEVTQKTQRRSGASGM